MQVRSIIVAKAAARASVSHKSCDRDLCIFLLVTALLVLHSTQPKLQNLDSSSVGPPGRRVFGAPLQVRLAELASAACCKTLFPAISGASCPSISSGLGVFDTVPAFFTEL